MDLLKKGKILPAKPSIKAKLRPFPARILGLGFLCLSWELNVYSIWTVRFDPQPKVYIMATSSAACSTASINALGPHDLTTWFPLRDGDVWQYRKTRGGIVESVCNWIGPHEEVRGEFTHPFIDPFEPAQNNYRNFTNDERGLVLHQFCSGARDIFLPEKPMVVLPAGIVQGGTHHTSSSFRGTSGAGHIEMLDAFLHPEPEDVKVPAGRFPRTLRVELIYDGFDYDHIVFWVARDIGVIKGERVEKQYRDGEAGPARETTIELSGAHLCPHDLDERFEGMRSLILGRYDPQLHIECLSRVIRTGP